MANNDCGLKKKIKKCSALFIILNYAFAVEKNIRITEQFF